MSSGSIPTTESEWDAATSEVTATVVPAYEDGTGTIRCAPVDPKLCSLVDESSARGDNDYPMAEWTSEYCVDDPSGAQSI
eukprot:SAG31_NODE_1089_length_9972_cov_4.602856_14_plen_80_part_00